MHKVDPDIERWLQLLVDNKLKFSEFIILGKAKGLTFLELMEGSMGAQVIITVPREAD
jgi:hypothetical protein